MKICFICHANICRSFMAQELFKKIAFDNKRNDIEVFSRGTYVLQDLQVPDKIKNFLAKNNIIFSGHTPVQYCKKDLETADFIFVMTKEQLEQLTDLYAHFSNKIYLLSSFVYGSDKDMIDPINKKGNEFEAVVKKIKQTINDLYYKI